MKTDKLDRVKEYICLECGNLFTPRHHGNTKKFCSHLCANRNRWAKFKEKQINSPKPKATKICKQCGNQFEINKALTPNSIAWAKTKFCSVKCLGESNRIKDGLNKQERYNIKRGRKKRGTPELIEMIKIRTKEAMQRPEVKQKISNPKPKWSLDRKISHSNKLAGKLPKNLNLGSFSNIKRGTYFCSKGDFFFRSKWEANYALYLDFLVKNNDIKSWDYEIETFIFHEIQFGTRSYTPDFKIVNNDGSVEFHEIKGYMTSRSKTQLKRMAKYYPDVKLILVDKKPYQEIITKLKGIIRFN